MTGFNTIQYDFDNLVPVLAFLGYPVYRLPLSL